MDFRSSQKSTAESRSTIANVPVNDIIDNARWSRGSHTIQVGGNGRMITDNRSSNLLSFDSASSNPYWLNNRPDPSPLGGRVPLYSSGFKDSFLVAYANLVSTTPQLNSVYNSAVNQGATSWSLLGQGAFIHRSFRTNEFAYYLENTWRATPKLILTYGIRHTILQAP